jgi:hypothetical protein
MMTRTESMLIKFISDHEAVLTAALESYSRDFRDEARRQSLRSFQETFNESADKADDALDALEKLAETVEELL